MDKEVGGAGVRAATGMLWAGEQVHWESQVARLRQQTVQVVQTVQAGGKVPGTFSFFSFISITDTPCGRGLGGAGWSAVTTNQNFS
jgi:hypothetical protein